MTPTPDTTARTETAETVTVPREPTREMVWAGLDYQPGSGVDVRRLYQRMIDVAPALASPQHPVGVREALETYYARQIEWSRQTFGPALRTGGVIDHIRKELREIEAEPHDLSEWVDVIILAMDGYWRHGGTADDLMPALLAKQAKNMARTWPDWRTMSESVAIEHDRTGEFLTSAKLDAMNGLTLKEVADHRIKHGRSATISHPPAQDAPGAVKVKVLEWGGNDEGTTERAATPIGEYAVKYDCWAGQYAWCPQLNSRNFSGTSFQSKDDAKAAAQADYNRRIKSALEGGGE